MTPAEGTASSCPSEHAAYQFTLAGCADTMKSIVKTLQRGIFFSMIIVSDTYLLRLQGKKMSACALTTNPKT